MRMQAVFHNTVIAESDETVVVEGNHYFPESSIVADYFKPSALRTTCHWKGVASYYSVEVAGAHSQDAAWYYPEPSEQAKQIKDHVAFWKDVVVRPVAGHEDGVAPTSFDAPDGAVC